MKNILLFTAALAFAYHTSAQQTGSFMQTVTFNSQPRQLNYFVPANYSSANKYALVIGLHGCGGPTAQALRDELKFIADSMQAIVVCPQGQGAGQMAGADIGIMKKAIDTTRSQYNIDTGNVFIFGFSCNGYTAIGDGTHQINFKYKGVIALNSYIIAADFSDGSFNYNTTTPVCICSGTADPYYTQSQQLRDSFMAHGAPHLFNSLPGVGHTTSFPAFKAEMMECFNYFKTPATAINTIRVEAMQVYPNPAGDFIIVGLEEHTQGTLTVYDMTGRGLISQAATQGANRLDTHALANGVYVLALDMEHRRLRQHIVIAK